MLGGNSPCSSSWPVLLTLCLCLPAVPAAADWLVGVDGARIETRGPWEVQGKLVVFTLPGGELASLRLSEVDLEASEELTAEMERRKEAPEPAAASRPRREPVMVLTDADVSHVAPEAPAGEAAGADGEEGEGGAEADTGSPGRPGQDRIQVVDWDFNEERALEGLEIQGTIRNRARDLATDVVVRIEIMDEEGEPLAEQEAILQRTSLLAGQTTTFTASFPELLSAPQVRITTSSRAMSAREEPIEVSIPGEEEG